MVPTRIAVKARTINPSTLKMLWTTNLVLFNAKEIPTIGIASLTMEVWSREQWEDQTGNKAGSWIFWTLRYGGENGYMSFRNPNFKPRAHQHVPVDLPCQALISASTKTKQKKWKPDGLTKGNTHVSHTGERRGPGGVWERNTRIEVQAMRWVVRVRWR